MDMLKQRDIQFMFARIQPEATEQMEREFIKHYNDEELNFKIKTTDLFDASKLQTRPLHLVFCLDESGSMGGKPWSELMSAYSHLLKTRMGLQAAEDKVSVITFNDQAHHRFAMKSLSEADQYLQQTGGGTSFTPALRYAQTLLADASAKPYTPVLIFMSDGQGEHLKSGPIAAMQSIVATCSGSQLQVYTIAFGSADKAGLAVLAAAGRGVMKEAATGSQLYEVFGDIAAGCSALDGLVDQFAAKISDMVADKIVLDHM